MTRFKSPIKKNMHSNKIFFYSLIQKKDIETTYLMMLKNIAEGCPHSLKLFYEYVIGKPRDHDAIAMHNQRMAVESLKFLVSKAVESSLTKEELKEVIKNFDVKNFDSDFLDKKEDDEEEEKEKEKFTLALKKEKEKENKEKEKVTPLKKFKEKKARKSKKEKEKEEDFSKNFED